MGLDSRQTIGGLVSPWDVAIRDKLIFADDGVVYHDLQSAVDNADGFVYVGPGTITDNIYVENPDITIRGSGRASVIDGAAGTNPNGTGEAIRISAQGVVLQNLAVKTDPTNGGACINYGSAAGENSRRGIAQRIWLAESGSQGIVAQEDDISISSVIAEDGGGGFAGDVFQTTGGSTDCRFFDCYVMNGAAGSDGFRIDGNDTIVAACEVDNPSNAAFVLGGDTNIIASNIMNGGATGVDDNGTNNKVHGNLINGATTGIDTAGATTPQHADNTIL